MKLLDFSKMVAVSRDDKTTTFKHEKGHEIKILHKALPKIQQEQIKRIKLASGGKVKKYSDGTPDDTVSADDSISPDPSPSPTINIHNYPSPVPNAPVPAAEAPLAPAQPPAPAETPEPTAPVHDLNQEIAQGDTEQIYALEKQAQRLSNAQNQMRTVVKHTVDDQTAGVIDPKHYAESMSSDQKTGTAIGLALMGFGGTGQAGLNFINEQIQRDVQSQKDTFQNKNTIYGAYQHMFDNEAAATNMALATQQAIVAAKIQRAGVLQGTPVAAQRAQQLASQFNAQAEQNIQKAAQEHLTAPPTQNKNRVLTPDAERKYKGIMFDPSKSPQQKAEIEDEYIKAVQADKALGQIEELFPVMKSESTLGGYLSHKINPAVVGGMGAAAGEALGLGGAPITGGASLLAAAPMALLGGAGGTGLGHLIKQGLRAAGGQSETKYETDKATLRGLIGGALNGAHATPTEMDALADEFMPTRVDDDAAVKNKLDRLREKILTIARTGALKANKMTND